MAWPLISRMHSEISRQAAPRVSILQHRPVNMRALIEEFTEFIDKIVPETKDEPIRLDDAAPAWLPSVHVGTSAATEMIEVALSGDGADSIVQMFNIWYTEKFRLGVWCATAAALCVGSRLTSEESTRERCLRCAEALAGASIAADSVYIQLGSGARAQLLMEILTPALELHAFGTAILRPEIFNQLQEIAASTTDITCSAHSLVSIVPLLVAHLNLLLRFLTEELRVIVHAESV